MKPRNEQSRVITPWIFSESLYQIQGQDFRLGTGRGYLKVIHQASIKEVLLMTGRQVEKSTTVSVKIANNVLLRNFSRNLYVAPLNEQVKTFSKSRLDKLFRYSKNNLVARRYKSNQLTDQVFHKEFQNGSEVYMRNCFEEADNIRGLSIDDVFIDEVQDIIVDALPVIMETQTRSKDKHLFLTGTPKTFSNTIQQKWDESSQADWVIHCPHCRKEQVLGAESVTPHAFICRNPKCGRPLDDMVRAFGRWEHRHPERKMKGFRITQMMVPDIPPGDIYDKVQNYPIIRLYNEVLGRSYEQADKPFSDQVISNMLDYEEGHLERTVGEYGKYANMPAFLGIDWGEGEKNGKAGTGYTVMSVGVQDGDTFRILFAKRFERGEDIQVENQIAYVGLLVQAFGVRAIIADYGAGFYQNQQLRMKYGTMFHQCHYLGSLGTHYKYDESSYKFLVHRTKWMTEFITECKKRRVRINAAGSPNLDWMKRNLKGIYSEYRPASSNGRSEELFYGHPVGEPDDFCHSMIYCQLASRVYSGEVESIVTQSQKPLDNLFAGAYGS